MHNVSLDWWRPLLYSPHPVHVLLLLRSTGARPHLLLLRPPDLDHLLRLLCVLVLGVVPPQHRGHAQPPASSQAVAAVVASADMQVSCEAHTIDTHHLARLCCLCMESTSPAVPSTASTQPPATSTPTTPLVRPPP